MSRKKKAEKAKPTEPSFFITACKQFTEITNECYPGHLLVLFASEPPQDGNFVTGACAWPEADKRPQAVQMISGIMAQNSEACSMLLGAVGHWISLLFGEDKEGQYAEMLAKFRDERLAKEKEMSPNADGQ